MTLNDWIISWTDIFDKQIAVRNILWKRKEIWNGSPRWEGKHERHHFWNKEGITVLLTLNSRVGRLCVNLCQKYNDLVGFSHAILWNAYRYLLHAFNFIRFVSHLVFIFHCWVLFVTYFLLFMFRVKTTKNIGKMKKSVLTLKGYFSGSLFSWYPYCHQNPKLS